MFSIILSLICSLSVGVLLKVAKQHKVVFMQVIGWNYLVALLLSIFVFEVSLTDVASVDFPMLLLFSLWVLLPTVFLFQALSLKHVGIVKTDIAQRLSLFIPILASYFLFGERFSTLKIVGFGLAFTAIFFTLNKSNADNSNQKKLYYPLLVLLGFGIIDVLLKSIASATTSFTTLLFCMFAGALVIAWGISIAQILTKRYKFSIRNLYWGVGLGMLNFGNVFFYLRAHKELSDSPSTVFATMNMGVIIFGSLIGVLFFKEKLNKHNYFGILLALSSIVLIVLSQLYDL